MSDSSDLDAFPPLARTVRARGEDLSIMPFVVGDVPAVIRSVRAVEPMFAGVGADELDWIGILDQHGDDLINLIAVGARKPPAWVRELPMTDFLLLAAAVYEVNHDFFVHRLRSTVTLVLRALNGLTPSAASSQPDTAART